jgi:uncharacterized protein (DUF885 family)
VSESERFAALAASVVDGLLQLSPSTATLLGEHRYDDQLETWTKSAVAERLEVLREAWAAVDQIDVDALTLPESVDLELLRDRIGHETWSLQDDRRHQRDPMRHLPVAALLALTDPSACDPAALVARLGVLPARLDTARRVLDDMCPEHVETAQARCRTLRRWLAADGPVAALAAGLDVTRGAALAGAAGEAEQAVASFERWLGYRLPVSDGDARIGPAAYHALTWFGLDSQVDLEVLLTRIESDLQGVEEEVAELAGRLAAVGAASGGLSAGPDAVLEDPGELVAGVLQSMAAEDAVSGSQLLSQAQHVLTDITARVRELDLVDVPDVDLRLVVVPDRRAAMRWTPCRLPQRFSSSTAVPSTASSSRITGAVHPQVTLQREGDVHALRRAAMHAVLPGHLLETLHSPRSPGTERVRVLCQSEVLREGWAGYAEDLLAGAGLGVGPGQDDALRLHTLLSRLRATVAALVDVKAHAEGLTEAEGLRLLTSRGHLAPADAQAAWRQSMLTPAVLVQHYLGRRQVADLVDLLRRQRPTLTEAALHRLVLDHGPVPPRRLAQLLGLD